MEIPPSGQHRTFLAFAIAPMTAGAPFAVLFGLFMTVINGHWPINLLPGLAGPTLLVAAWAYPIALMLGVPAYLILRKWVRLTWLNSALAGAVIGGLVSMGFLGAAAPQLRAGLLLHGVIGWQQFAALGVACGTLPGLTFFVIATRRPSQP